MNAQTANHFAQLWALGYHRLCPILPPDAPISERSSLYKRVKAGADPRGKAPGIKHEDGTWSGFDFVNHESTEGDCTKWHAMNAGVGIKTGRGLVLIDADTMNLDCAKIIKDTIEKTVGPFPVRIGKYPKAGYLVRTDEDFQYTRIEFGERDAKGRLQERVEILAEGRQFVAHGVHPATQKPYRWPQGVPALADVPFVAGDALLALLEQLRPLLPAASEIVREGAPTDVDQNSLRGDIDLIRKAVAATPNTSALFPTREAYRDYGYAIKAAAGPEHEAEALEIYLDWCARWVEGDNDEDVAKADWGRMKPPFRRGANWIYELAERHGEPGAFNMAERWFDLEAAAEVERAPVSSKALFEVLSVDDLFNRPDPSFLIDRHIPEASVGFLYGDPGTGKSFVALDWALHMAYGRQDWHGDPIKQHGQVIYIAGEGASGFKTRVAAWMHRHEIDPKERGRFGLIHQAVNMMAPEDVQKLGDTLHQVVTGPVRLVVVDTVSRAMPGADENLQKEMTLFVRNCDIIKNAFRCAVLGVHHAGKRGDMRGSTVLLGAGDYVFKLERKKGAVVGRLLCEKQKDAPDGWSDAYRFDTVTLGENRSSLVPVRMSENQTVDTVLTPEMSRNVLSAIRAAWQAGEPWARAYQAGERMAARRMVSEFGFDMEAAENILDVWLGSGVLVEDIVSNKSKRKGLRVADDAETTYATDDTEGGENVFE